MKGELLDIVNDCDEVIGTILKDEAYRRKLEKLQAVNCYIRVINCFIVNSSGALWIPRRTAEKKLFANCLDVSIGGHVQGGESYRDAFFREALEEVQIDCHKAVWKEIGYLTPEKIRVSAFMKVYMIRTKEEPDFNRGDFSEAQWVSPDNLLVEIEKGSKAKDDLVWLIREFFYDPDGVPYVGRVKNKVSLEVLDFFLETYPGLDEESFNIVARSRLKGMKGGEDLPNMSSESGDELRSLFKRLPEERIVEWIYGIWLSEAQASEFYKKFLSSFDYFK